MAIEQRPREAPLWDDTRRSRHVGREMTLNRFLKLPETKPALELFLGRVIQKVPPYPPHGLLKSKFAECINSYAMPRKLAIAFTETRASYDETALVPDVAVYRWHRVALDPTGRVADSFSEPWDLAIEILSPGQSRTDLAAKCHWFADHGAAVALLVDPQRETIAAFRPDGSATILREADIVDFADVLPGLQITVAGVFAWLYPGRSSG